MKETTIKFQNKETVFTESGQGNPILFLHGNPDTRHYWDKVIELLPSDKCHIYAFDLPGFGDSTIEAKDFDASLDGMANWVNNMVEAAGIETPLDIVVHDFGGVFGLAWLCRFPEKVRRIIITNTLFQTSYRWHTWARIWRTPILGELSMLSVSIPIIGKAIFATSVWTGAKKLKWSDAWHDAAQFTPATRKMVLHIYRTTNPENFESWEAKMKEICAKKPTIVLWGSKDIYIQKRFASMFGTTKIKFLEDTGHWVATEAPEELANCVQEHFLNK